MSSRLVKLKKVLMNIKQYGLVIIDTLISCIHKMQPKK